VNDQSHPDALAILQALLWSPPDGALFATAEQARARGRELFQQLVGSEPLPDLVNKVKTAAQRAAAADLFPGDDPDARWVQRDAAARVGHPFGTGSDPRAPIVLPGHDAVRDAVAACAQQIESTAGAPTPWQLALAVWRFLPGQFQVPDADAASWRSRSPLAHPAYPDPVEAVGALRAGVVAAGPDPAVLLFTLASVQDYIGEARRTQDLWMGSYLYAYLMWHAIRSVIENLGPWAVLTPSLREHPFVDLWLKTQGLQVPTPSEDLIEIASLPNIFAAIVPRERGAEIAETALGAITIARNRVACAVRDHLESAAATVFPTAKHEVWKELWRQQIEEFAVRDAFWVVVPWENAASDRKRMELISGPLDMTSSSPLARDPWLSWLKAAEELGDIGAGAGFPMASGLSTRLLATRKNRREFGPAPAVVRGSLCTLCASRTALKSGDVDSGPFWSALSEAGTRKRDQEQIRDQGRPVESQADAEKSAKLQGRIRAGERLCAPCAMKRLAGDAYFDLDKDGGRGVKARRVEACEEELSFDRHRFPSTATVATAPVRRLIINAVRDFLDTERDEAFYVAGATHEWLDALDKAVEAQDRVPANVPKRLAIADIDPNLRRLDLLDGSWFDTNAYRSDAVRRELRVNTSQSNLTQASLKLRQLIDCLKDWTRAAGQMYRPPARYFAVIALDGDKVGDWLQGKKNPTFGDLLGPEFRQEFSLDRKRSTALGLRRPPGPLSQMALAAAGHAFALEEAYRTVESVEHDGWLIYAGGDDVLAVAPRESAFGLARALNASFRRWATESGDLLLGNHATLSAAIVVAHASDPLGGVIRSANDALKNVAKATYGRDAFAVRILKRSGPPIDAGLPWSVEELPGNRIDAANHFETVCRAMANGALSRSLLSDVRRRQDALGVGSPQPQPAARGMMLYLAGRHLNEGTGPPTREETLEALGSLFAAAEAARNERDSDGKFRLFPRIERERERPTSWDLFVELLRAAEFLARDDEE
jgi:CRISPR-associated protein Cmr2